MLKPFAIGAVMAVMMIAMLHEPIMSGEADLTLGAVAFVAAHLAVALAILGAALFVPKIGTFIRGHRPSLSHMAGMLGGAAITAGAVHLVMHGLVV